MNNEEGNIRGKIANLNFKLEKLDLEWERIDNCGGMESKQHEIVREMDEIKEQISKLESQL